MRKLKEVARIGHITPIECSFNVFGSVRKDTLDIRPNEEPIDQAPSKNGVLDMILHQHASTRRFEAVPVYPAPVRTSDLSIDELEGWVPALNDAAPTKWDSMQPKLIVDSGAFPDGLRGGFQNSEVEPRRSERLKIIRMREELEHAVDASPNPLLALQNERLLPV